MPAATLPAITSSWMEVGPPGEFTFSTSMRMKMQLLGAGFKSLAMDLRAAVCSCLLFGQWAHAVSVTPLEMADVRRWVAAKFEGIQPPETNEPGLRVLATPPFSFKYGDQSSATFLVTWPVSRTATNLDDFRTQRTLAYADPKTGLEVRCEGIEYRDFPTVEWTLHFHNAGTADTPVLSAIQALNTSLEANGGVEYKLHHHKGTVVGPDDFEPLTTVLGPNKNQRFAPPGGRPLGAVFPYFNPDWGGEGRIIVVGWPGQWAAQFTRDSGVGLNVTAGQELTHLRLRPG